MSMNISKMDLKTWTWQWLALLGLLALVYHAFTWARIELREPISVFYDYPYSDVVLVKRACPVRGSTSHDLPVG